MDDRPLPGLGGDAEAVVRKSKATVWTLDAIQDQCLFNYLNEKLSTFEASLLPFHFNAWLVFCLYVCFAPDLKLTPHSAPPPKKKHNNENFTSTPLNRKHPLLPQWWACTFPLMRHIHWDYCQNNSALPTKLLSDFIIFPCCQTSEYSSRTCQLFCILHSFSFDTLWQLAQTVCFNNQHRIILAPGIFFPQHLHTILSLPSLVTGLACDIKMIS